MLAEDDENDVLFMQLALEKAGVTAPLHVAKDGLEVLAYLRGLGKFADRQEHPLPYLLLLDLKLPRLMGLEVLSAVRQRPEFNSIMVIVISSSQDPNDIERAYQLKANAFLIKPASIHKLELLVQSIKDFWFIHNQRVP